MCVCVFCVCGPKGDILVSIQGKNVIGIRRIAIERILKQYKVDQEIEIVVCRLKDPKFVLNLTKANQSPLSNQVNLNSNSNTNSVSSSCNNSKRISTDFAQNNTILNVVSDKYRSINEQIFNELILFQDPSYIEEQQKQQKPPRASRASTSTNSSNQSINQQKMIKTQASSSSASQNQNQHLNEYLQYYNESSSSSQMTSMFTSSKQTKVLNKLQQQRQYEQSIPIGFDENLISIQLNSSDGPNTRSGSGSITSSSSSSVLIEQPIQITPNPDNHKFVTLRPTLPKNAPPPSSNSRRLSKPNNVANANTNSVWSDSGYADSTRKSDNKSSYYSDISITVYDNIVGSNSAQTNTGTHMINNISSNNKNNVESTPSHVSVTIGGQQAHVLHPQIQPMNINQFNSQYVPNQLLPVQYTQTKSMSVNDFTGR